MSQAYRDITARRYAALYDRYQELHEVERRRHDDCVHICMKEFFYASEASVMRILKQEHDRRTAAKEQPPEEGE
jgi:hypothetical protein